MTWASLPMCGSCWQAYCVGRGQPGKPPITMTNLEIEVCCTCAGEAEQGIYVRLNTDDVPFPPEKVESAQPTT